MRIAIDYRVMSTEAADRGMGRYTQRQLLEVLRRDRENEYVVMLFPGCRTDAIDAAIVDAENVELRRVSLPTLADGIYGVPEGEILRFSAELQDWLLDAAADVYHATTPFISPVVSDFDACPAVATLYDLIPLVYPRRYFGAGANSPEYIRGLELVSRARRVLAISGSARDDAQLYLGLPPDGCTVAYPAIEPAFRSVPAEQAARVVRRLGGRKPIAEPFLLSVTGIHHSKNATALLAAHQLLRKRGLRLPLVCVLPTPSAYETFASWVKPRTGVTVLLGVSDAELTALFNAATLVVHPSRYEGFGYPVVEGMSCGTPVITTTAPALREVAGDAAWLVDPDDVEGLAEAIETAWDSAERREEMSKRGLEVVQRFNAEQLATTTIEAYEAARPVPAPSHAGTRRLALWSSLPPLKCGVGDYTSELLEPLAELAHVEAFVGDGYVPASHLTARHTVHHYSAFERRDRQRPFDAVLYQMGGTYMQEFMYDALRRRPGLVILHDLLMGLGFFFIHRSNQTLGAFRETIVEPEGDGVAAAFDRIMQSTGDADPAARLEKLFDEHYLLGWIIDNSIGQIVHMNEAKNEIDTRYPGARVSVVDMGVTDPWRGRSRADVALARWRHGLPSTAFVAGIFGSVVPVKRIEVCLAALARARESGVDCIIALVGDQPDPTYMTKVTHAIHRYGLSESVRVFGRVERAVFDELLVGVDAVLNLRFPSRKGMSAILMRALAAGKPVIASDIPEWRYLPRLACHLVAPGSREAAQIADRVVQLATDTEFYNAAASEARSFYEQRGTLQRMAKQYVAVVERVLDGASTELSAQVG